jgi:excisionase family DNA binding protein
LERLLRIDEAADRLGLRPGTIRTMIRTGRLPVVRPTGRRAVRVREEDVRALIAGLEGRRSPGTSIREGD